MKSTYNPYSFDDRKSQHTENLVKSYYTPELEKSEKDFLEKSKTKGYTGEIREWNGKKYRKTGLNKWVRVSNTHNLTKREHQEESIRSKNNKDHYEDKLENAYDRRANDNEVSKLLTQYEKHQKDAQDHEKIAQDLEHEEIHEDDFQKE